MPGLDRRGPMGMGPMTGGGRGLCSPSSHARSMYREGFDSRIGWNHGRGRGYCNMFRATGLPGWLRFGSAGPWGSPYDSPYTKDQEVVFLKDRATALKKELDVIDSRLRDVESKEKTPK